MNKKNVIAMIGAAAGVGTAGYLLMNEEKRNELQTKGKSLVDKWKQEDISTLDEAGIPGQTGIEDPSQFENAKMVSEGSQFGVNYFNEVKEEEQ